MNREIDINDIHVLRVGSMDEWREHVQSCNFPQPKSKPQRQVLGSIRDVVGAERSPTMSEMFA